MTKIDNTAPVAASYGTNIHPLADFIVYTVPRDRQASLRSHHQPSPLPPSSDVSALSSSLSPICSKVAPSPTNPQRRVRLLPKRSALSLSLLGTPPLLSSCFSFSQGYKALPLQRTPPQYLADLSPGASASASKSSDTGFRLPSLSTLLTLGGAARTEVGMASRWGTKTLRMVAA